MVPVAINLVAFGYATRQQPGLRRKELSSLRDHAPRQAAGASAATGQLCEAWRKLAYPYEQA
jgi:hypothetical protein